ncbi:hypothetical protein CUR178_05184 [Leishmania enriettii]|uniref:PH domain-containing protein n=1 Tax=Leishmania enriettii TaxID=5663 RepID=A0A836H4J5_LEIEN|nr:hypothetical protein CUR178_05184 [Leishmania enriettii]
MLCPTDAARPRGVQRALPAPKPPLCEGWLEKLALCRGVFSKKGWHHRYAFITREGLGLSHRNPRDKGDCLPGQALEMLHAQSFIPFSKKRNGEIEIQPVYFVDDVSAARHPEVPKKSYNGICSESMSITEGSSYGASVYTPARTASATSGSNCTYYYFGLTFEEHRKRYLLLLRTSSPQEYIKWTTYLPLYVHEGSASRIVPLGHPLEAGRPQPVDLNHKRLTENRESTLPNPVTFYIDPDPCSLSEYFKVRRLCLDWDEGERGRLFTTAEERVRSLCGKSKSDASESIAEMQDQSEEEYRNSVSFLFEELSPALPDFEEEYSPRSGKDAPESCFTAIRSVEKDAGSSGVAQQPSKDLDPSDGAAIRLKVAKNSRKSISRHLRSNTLRKTGGLARMGTTRKRPRPVKCGTITYAGLSRKRDTAP